MSDKIPFTFKLDSKKKIGFSTGSLDEVLLQKLDIYLSNGIEISDTFYDDLFNDTVSNGHNLLKCNGIFTLDTTVVESMSVVIGKFLFRLLFTNTADFMDCLHKAKQTGSKIEIKLEFDPGIEDSKELAQLPWELMYCPESQPVTGINADDEEALPGGFFLSKEASIFREYKKYSATGKKQPRKLVVSVAFLTKDTDNLFPFYTALKAVADAVSEANTNIEFSFINVFYEDQKAAELLSKSELNKIFLKDDQYNNVDKIIHLICDVDTTLVKGGDARAFYFNKYSAEIEKIAFSEIYRYLTDYNILPDPSLKLLVLQAWKDANKYDYAGFEEFAGKIIRMNKDNQTAVLSMPYVLKEADSKKEMNPVFFKTFYKSLARSLPLTDAVKLVRNSVVPDYSYGFPLFYFSGFDAVLAADTPVITTSAAPMVNASQNAGSDTYRVDAVKRLLRHLDFGRLVNLEKELLIQKAKPENKEYITKIEVRLAAIQQLKKEK